jgi:hypothetical protein
MHNASKRSDLQELQSRSLSASVSTAVIVHRERVVATETGQIRLARKTLTTWHLVRW